MIERTADEVELAGQLEALHRADSLAAVQQQLRPQSHPDFNGCDCVECGEPLPQVRLEYSWVRCAPCQGAIELRLKQQRRQW